MEIYTIFSASLDIDECIVYPNICDETPGGDVCTNTVGDYTCSSCTDLDPDRIWGYYEREGCCLRGNLHSYLGLQQKV